MKVREYCKKAVVSIGAAAEVAEAAQLMRNKHVGFLVVHDDVDPLRKPIGVLTDRDLVLAVMARDVSPSAVIVKDIMTPDPLTAKEDDELVDLLQGMRLAGIRRVPVVDARGALVGVIAIDDIVNLITGLLGDVAGSIKSEQRQEWRHRAN